MKSFLDKNIINQHAKLNDILGVASLLVFGLYAAWLLLVFGHGFSFNDEAFYVMQTEGWRMPEARMSFSGTFWAPVFGLFNKNIYWFRVSGAITLFVSAWYFSASLFKLKALAGLDSQSKLSATLVIMCCSLDYYTCTWTLYTPSYNLLNLVTMLISTGILIRLISIREQLQDEKKKIFYYVAYAAIMGIAFVNKFTTCISMMIIHMGIYLIQPKPRWKELAILPILTILGSLIMISALYLLGINVYDDVSNAFSFVKLLTSRNIANDIKDLLYTHIPNFYFMGWKEYWFLPAIVVAIAYLAKNIKNGFFLLQVLVIVIMALFSIKVQTLKEESSGIVFLTLLSLWLAILIFQQKTKNSDAGFFFFLFLVFLSGMPIAYTFGTGMNPLYLTKAAQVFLISLIVITLIFSLQRKWIDKLTLKISLIICSLVPLTGITLPWRSGEATYGLFVPLSSQTFPVKLGSGTLMVDERTKNSLASYDELLSKAGFQEGYPMIDMTGRFPGLVYFAKGKPAGGKMWIQSSFLGNNLGAPLAAQWFINKQNSSSLSKTWLLAFPQGKGGHDWRTLLKSKVGEHAYTKMGEFQFPYYADSGNYAVIELWAPTIPTQLP